MESIDQGHKGLKRVNKLPKIVVSNVTAHTRIENTRMRRSMGVRNENVLGWKGEKPYLYELLKTSE